MKKIRINDFYEVIDTNEDYDISNIEKNLNDMKTLYMNNNSNSNIKFFLLKLITFLIYIIDVLVLIGLVLFDIDIKSKLLIIVFGLNILVGIVLIFNDKK